MVKWFNTLWHSLNGRIRLCSAIAVFGIAAAILFSFVAAWRSAYNDVYGYFRRAEAEMAARLNTGLEDIQNAALSAGYSTAVQRFLLFNNPETVIMNYNAAVDHIANVLNGSNYCRNIYLYSTGGRYLRANRYRIGEILEGMEAHAPGVVLNRLLFEVLPGEEGKNELFFYFPVYNILWVDKTNVILCVEVCDMEGITSAPLFMNEDADGTILLLYKNKIVSSSRAISSTEQEALSRASQGQGRVRIGGEDCLTIKVSLPEALSKGRVGSHAEQLWDFIYFIPERAVFSRILSQMNRGLLILSAVVLLMILILVFIIQSVKTGVFRIVEDLNTLEYGRQLPLRRTRLEELELISHSVGLMLGRINGAVQREQEANEKLLGAVTAQAQAEFMSYRTQISPHFLFNTLECMRAMARSSKDTDLETMISSMSRMFRYSIYAKPMVSLSMELEHMQNYMKVMNIRGGGRYTLKTSISEAAMDHLIPSMILQPLVENSITHGFADAPRSNCVILLEASCAGNCVAKGAEGPGEPLLIRLSDNGCGIESGALETLLCSLEREDGSSGAVHALHNIFRRMRLSFGNSFHFNIKSRQGYYTVIEMHIPGETELVIPEIK
jgi:two-component system sensor histidine kinase YesM